MVLQRSQRSVVDPGLHSTTFPRLATGYMLSRTFRWLHFLPRFPRVTFFPALSASYIFAVLGTGYILSHFAALHTFPHFPRVTFFPALSRVTFSPALSAGYIFSRAWNRLHSIPLCHVLHVFPRSLQVTSAPALAASAENTKKKYRSS